MAERLARVARGQHVHWLDGGPVDGLDVAEVRGLEARPADLGGVRVVLRHPRGARPECVFKEDFHGDQVIYQASRRMLEMAGVSVRQYEGKKLTITVQ